MIKNSHKRKIHRQLGFAFFLLAASHISEVKFFMRNISYIPKILTAKFIFMILDLKVTEVAKEIHVANSTVSMYLTGERKSIELELYLIEKVFDIKIKDYCVNEAD